MKILDERIGEAIVHFWSKRTQQAENQGRQSGQEDYGARKSVTGGKQLDGFIKLVSDLLTENDCPNTTLFYKGKKEVTLPGFFRPTKQWDLIVALEGTLLAIIEFKSHIGPSFGNNFNNRTEEAIGNATDLWTAYRDGAFVNSPRPWLGFLMLLEEAEQSLSPVGVYEQHFNVFKEFKNASYAKRYELFFQKLLRERLYDATCFLMSERESGLRGEFREPSSELSFKNFMASLIGHITGYLKMNPRSGQDGQKDLF